MKTVSPQLSEMLIVLKNINDNIRRLEKDLFDISLKIGQIERKQGKENKYTIVIEKPVKTAKESVKGEIASGK